MGRGWSLPIISCLACLHGPSIRESHHDMAYTGTKSFTIRQMNDLRWNKFNLAWGRCIIVASLERAIWRGSRIVLCDTADCEIKVKGGYMISWPVLITYLSMTFPWWGALTLLRGLPDGKIIFFRLKTQSSYQAT
jgi:hypothetical protein